MRKILCLFTVLCCLFVLGRSANAQTITTGVCGATHGLVNPVGLGQKTAIDLVAQDPVYKEFTGYINWENKHGCPAANGGPWPLYQVKSDVVLLYSKHIDNDHGACRLILESDPEAYDNNTGQILCHDYKMVKGQVQVSNCNALIFQDPIQKESDPNACPRWMQQLDFSGGLKISWKMKGVLTLMNEKLSWDDDLVSSQAFDGGSPAVVQLRFFQLRTNP